MRTLLRRTARVIVAVSVLASGLVAAAVATPTPAGASVPAVRHVFTIVLENKSWEQVSGATGRTQMPYLHALEPSGVLLNQMYGVDHASLTNYIAMTSGYESNANTRADCIVHYCPYPAGQDENVGDQLENAGYSWKGYMEDMGTPCKHPATVNGSDPYLIGYATRHNPFVYYDDVISNQSRCDSHDVDFSQFGADLAAHTVPNYSFIVPNTCNDAHDDYLATCKLGAADTWLAAHVPAILASPEYQADGMLVITWDEGIDARGCCSATAKGGRIHTLVLSPFIAAPGRDTTTAYSHYSLLRTVEDAFGLAYLRHAGDAATKSFGDDVFAARPANDFALTTPAKVTVARSDNTTVSIPSVLKTGVAQPLTFSVTSPSPTSIAGAVVAPATVNTGTAGKVKVTTNATTPLGEYVLTVNATGGGVSHQIPLTVVVLGGPVNGSFETGALAPWGTTKAVPAAVVTGGLVGTFAARTGDTVPHKGTSQVNQTFTVASTATTLSVRYKLSCTAKDWAKALLRDVVAKVNYTVLAKSCPSTGGFATVTYNVVALRGKSVKLTLESHDDGGVTPTYALWDEITVS